MTEPSILTCEEALRLLAAHLDGELATGAHADVERHLERCRSCYSRAEFERALKAELAALRTNPVPGAFEQRIRGMIDRFQVSPSKQESR